MSEPLPIGWASAGLYDVCAVLDGKRVPVNEKERAERLADAKSRFPYYGATGQVGEIDDFIFEGQSILLGEDGAPFLDPKKTKAYLVDGKYWVNNHAHILRAKEPISSGLLCHQLNTIDYRAYVSGTTRLKLTQAAMRDLRLVVPPANEQRRIVSKIDELFSRIDEGEQALKRVEKLVERYRQSVLKAAVTGELTRDWREARKRAGEPVEAGSALLARILKARRAAWEAAELAKLKAKGKPPTDDRWKQKYKEPEPPDTTDLSELPEGWAWASMGQIGLVSGGVTKNQRRQTLTAQRPYLRVANVYANRLDVDDVQRIGVDDGELDRVLLEKGDLLVVEGNGSIDQIGRVAVWDGSITGCVHQNHLIKVRCTELLSSWYALIWCLSPLGRDHIRRVASSTAGLHTLSISKIASLPVPVPTSSELDLIRDRFDQAVALVANEKQSLRQSCTTSAALRQSILKAAFSGQLVPQDLNDEPASKLLEHIATECAAAPSLHKRKKQSA